MADKLKSGISVVPTFVDGEAVRAAKLTAITAQLQRAVSNLEKAIGDIHDESFPYSSAAEARLSPPWGRSLTLNESFLDAGRSLDIVNLARFVGPASNLNPTMPATSRTIVEPTPTSAHCFQLKFPANTVTSSTDASLTTKVASLNLLNAAGEYFYDADTNSIYCVTATAGGTITYTTVPYTYAGGANYTGARFNVIPDPNQLHEGGDGCDVSAELDSEGRHLISLPVISHTQRSFSEADVALTSLDPLYQDQLLLPKVLVDNFTAGDTIPAGFLMLKNWTTGKVYDSATYTYIDSESFYISGVDLEEEVANGDQFITLTVGTDITTSIDDLRMKMGLHSHDGRFGEQHIEAGTITGWTTNAGPSGVYMPSSIANNHAPQYLLRDGKRTDNSPLNDDNAMRGDIWFGLTAGTPGAYLPLLSSGESYGVRFGGSGWRIYRNSSDDLVITTPADDRVKIETTKNVALFTPVKMFAGFNIETVELTSGSKPDGQYWGSYSFEEEAHGIAGHNVDATFSGIYVGPTSNEWGVDRLPAWDIDRHGTEHSVRAEQSWCTWPGSVSVAGTVSGSAAADYWVVPKIQIIHVGLQSLKVNFKDSGGSNAATWADVQYAVTDAIPLPSGLMHYHVIGIMGMLHQPDIGANAWETGYTNIRGQALSHIAFRIVSGEVFATIDCDTGSDSNNPYYWSNWMDAEGDTSGDAPNSSSINYVDVKITLLIAAPEKTGITNIYERT
jgi:hypothetical protein